MVLHSKYSPVLLRHYAVDLLLYFTWKHPVYYNYSTNGATRHYSVVTNR